MKRPPITPAKSPRRRPGSRRAVEEWATSVMETLRLARGQEFIIRRYHSPTGAWTARAKWAPLMPGVVWRACRERTPEGHTSALYAHYPRRGQ
jgi:hypothetical protein